MPAVPPVDAFWSVTVHQPPGRLVCNPIGRYAIGDRTPGLERSRDGLVRIALQHTRPDRRSNWLPTPAGPFHLIMRLYGPRPGVLDGRWAPPPVEREA